jgi:hypothetical protein
MCGGKKKAAPAPQLAVPKANPKAIADNSNDIVPGSKIAAVTEANPTSFGAELGTQAPTSGVA